MSNPPSLTSCQRKKIKLPSIKKIIIVASGKGGVGKSTVAANLAVYLAKLGYTIGLLDADIYGPSIPQIMGIESTFEFEDKTNKFILPERYAVKVSSIGFLDQVKKQALIWRGPLISKMLFKLLIDSLWGALDYLFIDTPPGTGDVLISLGENYIIDGAIIISTPQQLALNEASKSCQTFLKLDIPLIGIIENMSHLSEASITSIIHTTPKKFNIFGSTGTKQLENTFNIPKLGEIPLIPTICDLSDKGEPAVFNSEVEPYYRSITQKLLELTH